MGDTEEKVVVNSEGNEADVEDTEEADTEEVGKCLSAIQGSGVIAMLQARLGKLVGHSSGYIDSLPKSVKKRIKALKKLQWDTFNLEAKFYQEVHSLECKYAALYSPIFEKRCSFISGKVEPTEEECDFPYECDTEEEELAADANKGADDKEEKLEEDTKGIPEFWLTTFKNVALIADMIQDHDEPILRHLTNVVLKLNKPEEPMGFTLEFHFEPNNYFTNAILTKEYEMKCKTEEKDPLSFEGPEFTKCKGCTIDWKKGENVTVKTVKKKQKHKSKGSVRTVLKTVQNDSFFNFFNPPTCPSPDETVDSDTEALLNADFEIGHFLKDRVIPRAVLYFTGEALTDYEDDGEEEGDDDDENDSDPDYKVDKKHLKDPPPPECKHQ